MATAQGALAAPDRIIKLRTLLERSQKEIVKAFPQTLKAQDPNAERFRRIMLNLVNADGMENIGVESFVRGAIRVASTGLDPDVAFGQVYLIPYGTELQMVIGYKGMIALALRSGIVTSVRANLVWPGEPFEYEDGAELIMRHKPDIDTIREVKDFDDIKKRPRLVYGVAKLRDVAEPIIELVPAYMVLHRKSRSKSASSNKSPWVKDPFAMWRKTGVRALSSWIPQAGELLHALNVEADDIDMSGPVIDIPPATEPAETQTTSSEQASSETEKQPASGLSMSDFFGSELVPFQRCCFIAFGLQPTQIQEKLLDGWKGAKDGETGYTANKEGVLAYATVMAAKKTEGQK